MRVFVAGATGAIGRPLVRQLVERGHDVAAASRRGSAIDGATTVACDVLDRAAVAAAVRAHRPHVVVAEITSLPHQLNPRRLHEAYAANNRVRLDGTRNLLAAAQAEGADAFVAQSSGFWYKPTPGPTKTERDPFWTDAPEPIGEAVRAAATMEAAVQAATGLRTVLLRYGSFYGPGTWFARDGSVGHLVPRRQYPLVGRGDAVSSFVHVEDAASATVAAIERRAAGVFNIADDEPAPASVWLPELARALKAPPPRRVPLWVAKLAIGRSLATYTANLRGADNRLAKRELGWEPRHRTWRTGFHEALG